MTEINRHHQSARKTVAFCAHAIQPPSYDRRGRTRYSPDQVDISLLILIWPVCHQSVSLTARTLEEGGITTIIIGSGMNIVTHCKVPRYLHNNVPLGNTLGPPFERKSQRGCVEAALRVIEQSTNATVIESDLALLTDTHWQEVYNPADDSNRAELLKKGEGNRNKRHADKARGLKRQADNRIRVAHKPF